MALTHASDPAADRAARHAAPYDVERVRADFPILRRPVRGKPRWL